MLPNHARYQLRYIPIFYLIFSLQLSAALPVVTKSLSALSLKACHSPSHCHSFFLASSATGGARKRPQLRYIPIFYLVFYFAVVRCASCCGAQNLLLAVATPNFDRCHSLFLAGSAVRQRSETSPTALHPEIFDFTLLRSCPLRFLRQCVLSTPHYYNTLSLVLQ